MHGFGKASLDVDLQSGSVYLGPRQHGEVTGFGYWGMAASANDRWNRSSSLSKQEQAFQATLQESLYFVISRKSTRLAAMIG